MCIIFTFIGQYCGFVPAVENGYVISASGVQGADNIMYVCNDGFISEDDMAVTCLSISAWGPLPECKGIP